MKKQTGIILLTSTILLSLSAMVGGSTAQAANLRYGAGQGHIELRNVAFNVHSPSARKTSHWNTEYNGEELMPLAPDELAALESETRVSTYNRIRKIEKEKGVEVEVKTAVSKKWYEAIRKDAHVEIFVSGGGFSGGIDPKVNDQIMISNSGLVQRFYESEVSGKREEKKQVDRDELFEFAQWIAENGFFEFDREYVCQDGDGACLGRMQQRPVPIPLKIVVAIGPYRNVVSVPIFSPDKNQDYINYPDNLRKIVKAIYDFASL